MKSVFFTLSVFLILLTSCSPDENYSGDSNDTPTVKVYVGTSSDVAYTIRDMKMYVGTSYTHVAYTIRDTKICVGTSYSNIAYTIREDEIYTGTSYIDVAYTIVEDKLYVGTSTTDIAYTIR